MPEITRHAAGQRLNRHGHRDGYAAIVLSGGYVEAGQGARVRAAAGDVILHDRFDRHQDRFGGNGAVVLNLPLSRPVTWRTGRIDDADTLVRVAGHDPGAAAILLDAVVRPTGFALTDWVDQLAEGLSGDNVMTLAAWADRFGLRPASLSRGFALAYGVSPKRYRYEQRARRAVQALSGWRDPLSRLAATLDFADQAHMTRAVVALTGMAPGSLRAKSVQAGELRHR
ncbi:MAG: AraC family transcriptional regulator [Pseudomonadota bacterium]|nr:AraC family transcriptional regulator [Pseudomonadota bacterium]